MGPSILLLNSNPPMKRGPFTFDNSNSIPSRLSHLVLRLMERSESMRNPRDHSRGGCFVGGRHSHSHSHSVSIKDEFDSSSRGPRWWPSSRSKTKTPPPDLSSMRVYTQHYNRPDFETHYKKDSKFYVIKSLSEDDIHKSIKYNVWSSTPHGNTKLHSAFLHAQSIQSPLFLFFSVNSSGQFVGVAEMIGQVDFHKDMDFWQAQNWNAFFPVQWHIIKDVPNSQLRHILLDDARDVTFTRDAHQIGFKQGSEMLSIFKNYAPKTSLLHDFIFYETREKSLRRNRTKPDPTYYYVYTETERHDDGGIERSVEDLTQNLSIHLKDSSA